MRIVTGIDQVLANIAELERGRTSKRGPRVQEYQNLIKRGTCFLPYIMDSGLAFAPSRFIGYAGNKLKSHASNPDRDGRVTNPALSEIFACRPMSNDDLERRYIRFCEELGIVARERGTFGVARKYWLYDEVSEFLAIDLHADAVRAIENDPELSTTEKQQLIKARVGQGVFREKLLAYWKACCVTQCAARSVLRASHIKPWIKSSNSERLDVFNGLLLSPNADALFDKFLISFENSGAMLVSPEVTAEDLQALLGCKTLTVELKPQHAKYLAYHRDQFRVKHDLPNNSSKRTRVPRAT